MQTSRAGAIGAVLLAHASAYAQPQPGDAQPAPAQPQPSPALASEATSAGAPAPDASKSDEELDPFAFADFTWQSGNARTKDSVLGNKYFTGVLLPPINGATAFSGTPYFTETPGDPYVAWDTQLTFDYMPSQYITLRGEFTYRHASVPYFSGGGGVTPPGGNQGAPGSTVMNPDGSQWTPDLVQGEPRFTLALLVKL